MLPGLTQNEFDQLLLSVGKTTRALRPLSPVEVGDLCQKCIDTGASIRKITAALQMKDTGMITKFIRLRSLTPEAHHLISWGFSGDAAIGFSVASQLARMSEHDQEVAANAILKHRLSRDEMTSVIQLLERSGEPLDACIDRVIRRRPVVRLRHVVLGAVTSSTLQANLASLSQLGRDEHLAQAMRRVFPGARNFTARLGVDRFAIIGGVEVAETTANDPLFEQRLNSALEEDFA